MQDRNFNPKNAILREPVVRNSERNGQLLQECSKSGLEVSRLYASCKVEYKLTVASDAGSCADVSDLPSQNEIHLLYERFNLLRQIHLAQIGEGVRTEFVAVSAFDKIYNVFFDEQRNASYGEVVLKLHVLCNLGLQIA